jgi:hypothetical protein
VIVLAVNSRLWKTSHKYGIELPRSLKEALEIDQKNGVTFGANSLTKEMHNVCVAFEILGPKRVLLWDGT